MNQPATVPDPSDHRFFGHPLGLGVLFFTELWERFSYYGMRALLILYATTATQNGGLGFDTATGGAIYGLYTSLVYFMALPGGWIADRLWGQRRSVLVGGALIAAGHFCLAVPALPTFFGGLALIVLGTGLLKPNISVIVGQLYTSDDERRDSGFSLFYMGINFGALGGPLVCAWLGEKVDWHLGFGAAGVGMVLGLIVYTLYGHVLGDAGLRPSTPDEPQARAEVRRQLGLGIAAAVVLAGVLAGLLATGTIPFTATALSNLYGASLLVLIVVFFGWLLLRSEWNPVERGRLGAIFALFLAAAFFWGAYEQAGSTLTLFANDLTDRVIAGWEFPTGWFQLLPPIFVLLQAPLFAWAWLRLGKRQPSSPAKFVLGLLFVGLGHAVMIGGATVAQNGAKASLFWLFTTYFLHVVGEMFLSPVGLSTVTKLAPARVTSLMMGVWFLAASTGSWLAGSASGLYASLSLPVFFTAVASVAIGGAVVLALFVRPIRKLMGGIH